MAGYLIILCISAAIGSQRDPGQGMPAFEVRDLLQPFDWVVSLAWTAWWSL